MRQAVELLIAFVEQPRPLLRSEKIMCPGGLGSVESVEIFLIDPSVCQEFVILLRTRNGRQYVEGRDVGSKFEQRLQMLADPAFGIFREADDVGKVRVDLILPAKPYNFAVH